MAFDKMNHAMSDEEVRAWAMSREKGQRDIASSVYSAEQRGLETARQEGRLEGQQEGRQGELERLERRGYRSRIAVPARAHPSP